MKTGEFTVVSGCPEMDIVSFSEKLFEAGSDDATVSLQKGVAVIEFDRASKNFLHALKSAIASVEAAGGDVLHVASDPLVSLSDIAVRASTLDGHAETASA